MTVRIAAIVSYALVLGTASYGRSFDIELPGFLDDVWYGSALPLVIWILGVPVGFLAGRWWAALSALAPVAVAGYLAAIGHKLPWHDSDPFNPLLSVFAVAFYAVPLIVGVVVRVLWDARRGRRAQRPRSPTAISP